MFDFSTVVPAGSAPPAARWTGLAKYNFTGGNNDADQVPQLIGAEFDVDDHLDGLAQRDDVGSDAVFTRQKGVLDSGAAVAMPEQLEFRNLQVRFASAGSRPLASGHGTP